MTREQPSAPSKTRRKKDATAVQALGAEVARLTAEQRAKLPLGERTRDAIDAFLRIKSHEARRRQLQRIGALMREEDDIAVRIALAEHEYGTPQSIRRLRNVQLWQHRLLSEGDTGLAKLAESRRGLAPGLHARLANLLADHADGDAEASRDIFRVLYALDD